MLFFVLILLVMIFFILRSDKIEIPNINLNEKDSFSYDKEISSYEPSETPSSSAPNSSDGGGGGSSGESSGGVTCPTKQINYAMISPNKIFTCNQEQAGICGGVLGLKCLG